MRNQGEAERGRRRQNQTGGTRYRERHNIEDRSFLVSYKFFPCASIYRCVRLAACSAPCHFYRIATPSYRASLDISFVNNAPLSDFFFLFFTQAAVPRENYTHSAWLYPFLSSSFFSLLVFLFFFFIFFSLFRPPPSSPCSPSPSRRTWKCTSR